MPNKQTNPFEQMLIDILEEIEEELAKSNSDESQFTPDELSETTISKPSYTEPDSVQYNKPAHIVSMIEDITVNTLATDGKIKSSSIDNLATLVRIHEYYSSYAK